MATISTAARNAMVAALTALVDGGAGAGKLVIRSVADAEIATLTMSDPAFGAPTAGVATASAITADADATGGTATKFTLEDSNSVIILTGTTGTSGTEMVLSSVTIAVNDSVAISAMTLTQPAA